MESPVSMTVGAGAGVGDDFVDGVGKDGVHLRLTLRLPHLLLILPRLLPGRERALNGARHQRSRVAARVREVPPETLERDRAAVDEGDEDVLALEIAGVVRGVRVARLVQTRPALDVLRVRVRAELEEELRARHLAEARAVVKVESQVSGSSASSPPFVEVPSASGSALAAAASAAAASTSPDSIARTALDFAGVAIATRAPAPARLRVRTRDAHFRRLARRPRDRNGAGPPARAFGARPARAAKRGAAGPVHPPRARTGRAPRRSAPRSRRREGRARPPAPPRRARGAVGASWRGGSGTLVPRRI